MESLFPAAVDFSDRRFGIAKNIWCFLALVDTSRFSKSRSPVAPQHFQMPFGVNKISQDRQRDVDVPRFFPSLPSVVCLCQPLLERLCSPAGGF
jgi:hypothetical protein